MHRTTTLITALAILTAFVTTTSSLAQVPQTLDYQGYLTDSVGQAADDPVVVEFSVYTAESGGTPVWSEFQNIFPAQGLFTTSFGNDANPFPAGMFDTPLYLGVKVGVDSEMVPRTALSSAAFSLKASDAERLNGQSAAQLDQSADVISLNSSLNTTNSQIAQLQSSLTTTQADLNTAESDVNQLQSDLSTAEFDVQSIEATLPTLQTQVSGSCPGGSAIRQIASNGTVVCETDDAGPWSGNAAQTYVTGGTQVGIGTVAPAASLQIDSAVDVDPFRARVGASTKLRVHTNGSVGVGTSVAGPSNGLYVSGDTGLGTAAPQARLGVTDSTWQLVMDNNDTGGSEWYFGSSADAWQSGGGKFVISNTNTSGSPAMVIDSGKLVGIGTNSPTTRLQVNGGTDVSATNSGGYFMMGSATGSNIAMDNNEIMARSNGAAGPLALNAEGGEVTINSGGSRDNDSLDVRGRVYFDNGDAGGMRITANSANPPDAVFESTQFEEGFVGSANRPFLRTYSREFYAQSTLNYRTYSDRSLKSNIAPLDGALAKINALEGVKYRLDRNPMNTKEEVLSAQDTFLMENQIGFIAQDVEKVLPQLVTQDEATGLKTVAYMGVIPVLVEALKAQQAQIDEQRLAIKELEQRLQ